MSEQYDAVLKFAAHDPLLAGGLFLLAVLIIPLGGMHLIRIFGKFLVVLIGEFKDELLRIGKVFRNVRRELTTWKVDE